MARSMTGEIDQQLDLNNVSPILMLEMVLASATLRCWSGLGTLQYTGVPWIGTGEIGKIDRITESTSLQASGTSVELSAVDASLLSDALTEIRVGRPATIYIGFLNPSNVPVGTPLLLYRGKVDKPTITADPKPNAGKISIALESRMLDMQRVAPIRWSVEHQRRLYSTDDGLNWIAGLQNSINKWGY